MPKKTMKKKTPKKMSYVKEMKVINTKNGKSMKVIRMWEKPMRRHLKPVIRNRNKAMA